MLDNKDKILEKISKLMALAQNEGASIGEVENSMVAIKKLMVKYNLNDDDLITNGGVDVSEYVIEFKSTENKNWRRSLMEVIARNNMCDVIGTVKYSYKNVKRVSVSVKLSILGNRTNRKMVIDLYEICIDKFISLSKVRYEEYIKEKISFYTEKYPTMKINKTFLTKNKVTITRNKYITSYYLGCVSGMDSKLSSDNITNDMEVKEIGQYTLMIKKNAELLNDKISELFPNLRSAKVRSTSVHGGAYGQGVKDAKVSNKMLN